MVDKVYKEMVVFIGIGELLKEEVKNEVVKNLNFLQCVIKILVDIFIFILLVIVIVGLLMGINNVLIGVGIFYDDKLIVDVYIQWKDFVSMINLIVNMVFVFLLVFIGWLVVMCFGGSFLFGIVFGFMLVYFDLLNVWFYGEVLKKGSIDMWNLFGLYVEKVGY